ncbi:MAG: FAD-dependent oxidoreductase [Elusimicrobiota bacterium]
MTAKIKYVTADDYNKEVLEQERVVVDFYSTECPPCEALAPKFESLSEIYGDKIKFVKIFRQENRDLAESLDIYGSPTVIFYKDGELTGDRLTGGIKRKGLMDNLDALLTEEEKEEVQSRIKPVKTETELAIIGAGPAGLTAAIYAAQAKINTVLIDKGLAGGQVSTTHKVSNYPGFEEPVDGFMLTYKMEMQAKNAGANFRLAADVDDVSLENKTVKLDGYETIHAEDIIIATGASPAHLGLPGEKENQGKGISYCATCDAKYYEGKDVVVIGGGNSAIEEALFIAKFAAKITVVHQFDTLQANKDAQQKAFENEKIEFIFEHEPRKFINNSGHVNKVIIEDLKSKEQKTLKCDGVFIFVGMSPNTEFLGDELELDSREYIITDPDMKTSMDGIYAAGDVISKRCRQITTAVSDGTLAATTIYTT